MAGPDAFYSEHIGRHDAETQPEELPEAFHDLRARFMELVPAGHILDAGCGAGRDTGFFTGEGYDATGVDIAEGAIEYAREHYEGDFRVMDLRDLAFPDATFDGVWSSAAIFFVPEDGMRTIMEEFLRVLKPGGAAYIGLKLGDGPVEREKWGDTVTQYHVPAADARALIEQTGFDIVEMSTNRSREDKVFGNYFCRRPAEDKRL